MTKHERSAKEMFVICRCLRLSGEYDMLNAPTLACFEVLVQRLSQLVIAYRGGVQNPNWRATKHILSESSAYDVVPKNLEQCAHRLSK